MYNKSGISPNSDLSYHVTHPSHFPGREKKKKPNPREKSLAQVVLSKIIFEIQISDSQPRELIWRKNEPKYSLWAGSSLRKNLEMILLNIAFHAI